MGREVRHPKAEQIAENKKGLRWAACRGLLGIFGGGSMAGQAAGTVAGSVQTADSTGVWLIGMRYKIMDANTTEQAAQGCTAT